MLSWLGPRWIGKTIGRAKTGLKASNLVDHWRIAIRTGGTHVINAEEKARIDGFRWLEAPQGHAWTDPFLFERDGQYWLFFEDYLYARKRGTLACAPCVSRGRNGRTPDHSRHGKPRLYPYVFWGDDGIYMIPETRALQTVRLYKAVDFPYQWEPVADLFSGQAVDTSVWKQDGLWWIFYDASRPPQARRVFVSLLR